jgi:hypothetical protein
MVGRHLSGMQRKLRLSIKFQRRGSRVGACGRWMRMRWTRLCSVLGPRKMVRPENNLRTYLQLTCGGLGSILGISVRRNMRAYGS